MRFPLALCVAAALQAQPVPRYVGSVACQACHPGQFAAQSATAHAGALFRATDHPLATTLPLGQTLLRKPGYQLTVSKRETGFATTLRNATQLMELPLEWAFGAGRQAITFVSRVSPDWYVEHYATWYSAPNAWGPTPGQDTLQPADIAQAAGQLYKTTNPETGIDGCFACHSTGPLAFGPANEIQPREPGVRCEACHGPGSQHTSRPAQTNIGNPARQNAVQINEFCGKCHRPPAANCNATDWNHAWNVRHQPVYLSQAACFRKSDGALSCLTCHGPHETSAAPNTLAVYNSRCQACHAASLRPPAPTCQTNCVDCHMPRVSPQASLSFTNHWIGIYRNGAKLKPAPPRPARPPVGPQ